MHKLYVFRVLHVANKKIKIKEVLDRNKWWFVFLSVVEMNIHNYECIENCDCIDGYIKILSLPDEYKRKAEFKGICKKCKYHID